VSPYNRLIHPYYRKVVCQHPTIQIRDRDGTVQKHKDLRWIISQSLRQEASSAVVARHAVVHGYTDDPGTLSSVIAGGVKAGSAVAVEADVIEHGIHVRGTGRQNQDTIGTVVGQHGIGDLHCGCASPGCNYDAVAKVGAVEIADGAVLDVQGRS